MFSGRGLILFALVTAASATASLGYAQEPERAAAPGAVSRLMRWVSDGVTMNATQELEERAYCTNTPGQTIAGKTRWWLCAEGEKADHRRAFHVVTATIRNATSASARCTFPVAVIDASGAPSFDGVQTMTIPAGEAMALRVEEAVDGPKTFHHASIQCELPLDAYRATEADTNTLSALAGDKASNVRTRIDQSFAAPEVTDWTAEIHLAAFSVNTAKQVHVLRSAQ